MWKYYEILQISPTSDIKEIKKQYRLLSYQNIQSSDSKSMMIVNEAYQILIDPYKRAFYDKFGDQSLYLLNMPGYCYFVTHFFTWFNISCLTLYFYSILSNYFLLGFIYKMSKDSQILNFFLIIFSKELLILIFMNNYKEILSNDPIFNIMRFLLPFLYLKGNSIFILANNNSVWLLLVNQALVLIIAYFLLKSLNLKSKRLIGFLVLETILLFNYYGNYLYYDSMKYFIPSLISLSLSYIDLILGISVFIFIFPTCMSLYLALELKHIIIPTVINIINAVVALLLLASFVFSANFFLNLNFPKSHLYLTHSELKKNSYV